MKDRNLSDNIPPIFKQNRETDETCEEHIVFKQYSPIKAKKHRSDSKRRLEQGDKLQEIRNNTMKIKIPKETDENKNVDRRIIVFSRRKNKLKIPDLDLESTSEIKPLLGGASIAASAEGCEYLSTGEKSNSSERDTSAKFSFRGISRRNKCVVAILAFLSSGINACFSLIAPFFPKEAAKKGVSGTCVGMIFGVFELVMFIMSPILGNYLTRIGSKFMLIVGIIVCGFCSILFGLLDKCPNGTIHITMLFLCRIVEAVGAAGFFTACFAIVSNTFPDNVSTVVGIIETFSGIGMMAGPAIGGGLYTLGGYGLPFFVIGGCLLLSGFLCVFVMPGSNDKHHLHSKSVLYLLRNPYIWFVCCCIITGTFSVGFLEPTLSQHLNPISQVNGKPWAIGLIFLIEPAVYALTMPLWSWLSDAKGKVWTLMFIGCLTNAVGFLLLGPSPLLYSLPFTLWTVITALLVSGIGLGMTLLPSFRALLDGANELGLQQNFDTFGIVSGLFNSCFSLGAFLGSSSAGIFVGNIDYHWCVTILAGLLILSGTGLELHAVCRKYLRRRYTKEKPEILRQNHMHVRYSN